MLKPAEARAAITAANPDLATNPDRLQVLVDAGRLVCAGGESLSWEYRYTLNVIVVDYPGHPDGIFLPLLAWLRTNQPELFENRERQAEGIRFEAEFLTQETMDLSVEVDLTERVIVRLESNRLVAEHVGEPSHPELPTEDWSYEIIDRKTGAQLAAYAGPGWRPQL